MKKDVRKLIFDLFFFFLVAYHFYLQTIVRPRKVEVSGVEHHTVAGSRVSLQCKVKLSALTFYKTKTVCRTFVIMYFDHAMNVYLN